MSMNDLCIQKFVLSRESSLETVSQLASIIKLVAKKVSYEDERQSYRICDFRPL
jgi:hypothetical protein